MLMQSRLSSPTRQSRMEEKSDLQKNNDRLVCYIGRCRYLEGENERLTKLVTKIAIFPNSNTANHFLIKNIFAPIFSFY